MLLSSNSAPKTLMSSLRGDRCRCCARCAGDTLLPFCKTCCALLLLPLGLKAAMPEWMP